MPYLWDLNTEQHHDLRQSLHDRFVWNKETVISIWPTQFLQEFDHTDLAERELKVLNISIWPVMQAILSYGGQLTFHGTICDTYYYFPPEDKRKLVESLRIRTKNNDSYLTIKQKNTSQTIKERQEREVHLPHPEAYESLFISMGLEPLYSRQKVRFSYIIPDSQGDIVIDIDLYPGIPPMIELEWKDETHIRTWIKNLGIEKKKTVNRTARKTLEYYRKKKQQNKQ